MTGTSIDGIDAAMIEISGVGSAMSVRLVRQVHAPLTGLTEPLRAFARGGRLTAVEVASLARRLGEHHARVFETHFADEPIDFVVVHGQTVCHAPPDSLQLMNPWPLTAVAECPVMYDLRGADLAMGGQGAPITPIADAILYRDRRNAEASLAIVNLGGFINATLLPPMEPGADVLEQVTGFDCCPCNHLLDAASLETLDRPFDQGGDVAASGTPDTATASTFGRTIADLFQSGRSGGDGDEHRAEAVAIALSAGSPADGLATICQAIGIALAECISTASRRLDAPSPARLILAGGGVLNACLVDAIRSNSPPSTDVRISDEFGLPAQARESAGMATLGALACDGLPITATSATGRRAGTTSSPSVTAGRLSS
jgi:anhydro-N-acetylmuramic acid kinase